MGVQGFRKNYSRGALRRTDLHPDPFTQFGLWLDDAIASGAGEPTAMALGTADGEGRVSVRMVLLKGFDSEGFIFYSNFRSRKARDLEANPQAALTFYWEALERQLRIEGVAEKVPRSLAEAYFASRPRGSQLGAWASPQSTPLRDREELERRYAEAEARFTGGPVPIPEHWGGYRVRPDAFELWQGRADRLHDRFRYSREGGGWQLQRLAP